METPTSDNSCLSGNSWVLELLLWSYLECWIMTQGTTYQRRLRQQLCPLCGGKRNDGWILCGKCRAEMKPKSNSNNAKNVKNCRKRYQNNGLCYYCGKRKEDARHRSCRSCLDKKARWNKKNKITKILKGIGKGNKNEPCY